MKIRTYEIYSRIQHKDIYPLMWNCIHHKILRCNHLKHFQCIRLPSLGLIVLVAFNSEKIYQGKFKGISKPKLEDYFLLRLKSEPKGNVEAIHGVTS